MNKSISTVIIVVLVIVIAGFFYKRYKVPPALDLPVIALTDLSGNKVSLQSYAGHPLFLSFFATWCSPCMRELPELSDLREKLSDQKLQVICICDEPIEKLQTLQSRFGNKLVILHSEKKFHDLGIYTYPTNYIFNAKGEKVYNKVYPDEWENADVVNKIKHLIE